MESPSIGMTLPIWRDTWLVLQAGRETKTCYLRWKPTRLLISDILEKPVNSPAGQQILRSEKGRKRLRRVTTLYLLCGRPCSVMPPKPDSRPRPQWSVRQGEI